MISDKHSHDQQKVCRILLIVVSCNIFQKSHSILISLNPLISAKLSSATGIHPQMPHHCLHCGYHYTIILIFSSVVTLSLCFHPCLPFWIQDKLFYIKSIYSWHPPYPSFILEFLWPQCCLQTFWQIARQLFWWWFCVHRWWLITWWIQHWLLTQILMTQSHNMLLKA